MKLHIHHVETFLSEVKYTAGVNWGEPGRAPPSRLNGCAVYTAYCVHLAKLEYSHCTYPRPKLNYGNFGARK